MILAGTGHRPPRLNLGYDLASRKLLRDFVCGHLIALKPSKVISGGAQGFDQALAEAALELGIPLVVAAPFEGQEKKWPAEAQRIYRDILSKATVEIVCEGGYAGWKFIKRDQWMILNSNSVIALWDGTKSGGTWETVAFAQKLGREIICVWDEWLAFRGK